MMIVMARVIKTEETTSCLADLQASSRLQAPKNCETTTAPPVAKAASMLITRVLNISTKDTPETAASPAEAIIIVSAMPTVKVRACSKSSGRQSFFKSFFEKSGSSINFILSRYI